MTEEHNNGGAMRADIAHLKKGESELFRRMNSAELGLNTLQTKVEEYMLDQSEMRSDIKAIKERLYAFDLDQAKKWTKVGVIGAAALFLLTSGAGLIFTILKIFEMMGD